ncbi:MAG: antitoxin VapB family protein [Candidatus Heimdallarchaeaceae archaeon]
MTTKTISIKEEIYNKLVSLKRKDESFSDLLERLTKSVNTITILEQLKGTIDFRDTEELIDEIRKKRDSWRE